MLALLLLLSCGSLIPQGSDSDPELASEMLGITPLDAESIADDARSFMPPAQGDAAPANPRSGWSTLLPDVTLAGQYQTRSVLKDMAGALLLSLPESVIVLVTATWPLPEAGTPPPQARLRLAQAEVRSEAPAAPEPAPQPDPWEGEPSVRELQRAAEENLLLHPDDLRSLRSRAHVAAWLPELSAEYQRNVGNIDMLGVSSGEGVDTSALEDVSRYSVRATWKLSELVFSSQEVRLSSTALKVQSARHEVLEEVSKLYFERRRLQLRLRSESDPLEREKLELDIGERGAQLDALTGGLLSKRLHKRRPR